ncbi:MAG: TAXI family TRAP transporter solute-binding subunit, partial [Actinomycetota bacterium]
MMAKIKVALLSLKDLMATAWWIVLITGIGFVIAFRFVQPAPPTHIVITTGGEGGAYYHFAGRYAAILAKNGIALEVRPSNGSLDNLQRLEKGEAQVGFVQGGVLKAPEGEPGYAFEDAPLKSLGSVFYEPVWVFYRGHRKLDRLTELKGKRIAIGQEGSGVRQLAQQVMESNDIP